MTAAGRRYEMALRIAVRRRLGILLQWLTAHAIVRWRGTEVTAELMVVEERAVLQLLEDVSDDGGFSYFGIADAADLGPAPVSLYLTDDPRYRHGTTALDLPPLLDWIMRGGARGAGWRDPKDLTVDDLARGGAPA